MTQKATKHAIRTGGLSAKETFSPRSLPNFDPTPSFCMKTLKIAICIISVAGMPFGLAGCGQTKAEADKDDSQQHSVMLLNDGNVHRVIINGRAYIVYSKGGICPESK